MVDEDIHTIWKIFGVGGLIDKLGPDRTIRELKKRCEAGAIIGCSLYKLLIEKWIDVSTEPKEPGYIGPLEEFMQSAGEDELVKKIEDLHVQYPNGIPRVIRMDLKDDWNAELERKVGRRIPLDPKDASKKDIADSKKIAEQLAAEVGLPRPLKPKVGIEELPLPPPVKPVERAPPRAAPSEVVPTPIITRALPEFELMKKEIEERIQEEKRRRLKRGPIAGDSSDEYLIREAEKKLSELPREERMKLIQNIWSSLGKRMEPGKVITLDDISRLSKQERIKVARILMGPEEKKKEVMQIYKNWTFDDFKHIISRTTDLEDLLELEKHISESEVTTPRDRIQLRQIVEQREVQIRKGGHDIRKQSEEQERELKLATASRIRDDDIIKDDDVMQVPGDYAKWEFGDFEGQIPGLDDPEDLEILLEYTDVSDKLAKDEAKTLREMIKERIRKVEKAGS